MAAHDTEPSRLPRGVACAGHVFAAHIHADPGAVWTALTDPGQTAGYPHGLAAHSTWVPGDPIEFRSAAAPRPSAASCMPGPVNGCPTCCRPGRATRLCT